ncbi:glyoxalase-like domain protein [Arthrobacter sp. SW1]|uniref:VOC family protein n=1 Tax=Arthrobacter sp. SW1 TaxID=1920889 RepID=UPI000877B321|nr:VOC family protein [Arthrobacter sp. SW1]OFI37115.1 glyoxalase-like domain protein [Arthrobacter sp. SW1]
MAASDVPRDVPQLDGVHHLKLPVSDIKRSVEWYGSRLGYQVTTEFTEKDKLVGVIMNHPAGGPVFGLRLDPELAARAAGFDYFSIGVPTKEDLESLAARLKDFGDGHAGVHFATVGWILPGTHDPDGHEVRFYTTEQHTDYGDGEIRHVESAVRYAAERERNYKESGPGSGR